MEELFQELMQLCNCSVQIAINDHKDNYQTAAEWLEDRCRNMIIMDDEVSEYVWQKMIETNTIFEITANPNTNDLQSCFTVYHHDLKLGLQQIISVIKQHIR